MSDRPPGDDTSESCPELDDAYFEQIGKKILKTFVKFVFKIKFHLKNR